MVERFVFGHCNTLFLSSGKGHHWCSSQEDLDTFGSSKYKYYVPHLLHELFPKSEGHRFYILKTPRRLCVPERSPNVLFSQTPGIGPCRALPLEQLTKCASCRNCSKGMELRLVLEMLDVPNFTLFPLPHEVCCHTAEALLLPCVCYNL